MAQRSSLMLMKRFMADLLGYRLEVALITASIIGAAVSTVYAPYILGRIIDEYVVPGRMGQALPMVALYAAALLGQWLFSTIRSRYIEELGQRVLYNLRGRLYEKLLSMRIDYFRDKQAGDLVSRIINDTSTINEVLVSGVASVLGDVFVLIGVAAAMVMLSPGLTLAALAPVPLMILVAMVFGTRLRRAFRDIRARIAEISSIVGETLLGIETVKSFGREDLFLEEFEKASTRTVGSYMRAAVTMGVFWPLMNISSTLSVIIVLVYGGGMALSGAMSIGVVVAFLQYTQRFTGPINNIISMYDSLQSAFASLDRIYDVLDSEMTERYGGRRTGDLRGDIVYRDVWFEYEPGRPVLRGVSLVIRRGESVALVGRTGAGKTTLVNLLLKMYEPSRGEILIGDTRLSEIDARYLRSRVGYVPQETYLFPGTIMDNIRIARPGASDEEVVEVCRRLGIHEYIERLPKGYYTDAGEAGRRLSVGERQLISIARAMIRDPDIVVLDEALSSVDPETEAVVRKALKTLMRGRTSILVAHRLSAARDADKIIVVEDGRVVEEGDFNELMEKKGRFYALYMAQHERDAAEQG